MRFLRFIPLLLAITVIWALNQPFGSLPAIGKIIDPVNGAMAAAEPTDKDFNKHLKLEGLQQPVNIWLDTALIPHIRAANDHDLYYAQGFIHAYFRLWQMDMQTRAAWGRISEVAGPKAIDFDRGMRREGMVWGAQRSLEAMEKDPRTKSMLDAYRDGINAYISSLNFRHLPIEYKLMSFAPEQWTNLRTALLMKYMARDLTGKTDDIAFTLLRDQLGQEEFDFLFPERIKGSKPVIPEGTKWETPSLGQPEPPTGDVWAHFKDTATVFNGNGKGSTQHIANSPEAESGIGSNNWAISGKHTASGKPILCNDPHLGLNLPSLWYEMQLTAPGINCYGASLPGAPGIVIGFNEKISWGFTNNYRDVKDFYEIVTADFATCHPDRTLQDSFRMTRLGEQVTSIEEVRRPGAAYCFSGKAIPFECSIEVIKVKGQPDVIDTVLYTIHGPVTYDPSFPEPTLAAQNAPPPGAFLLACTWMAHRGSNELLATYLLNRAGDYNAFTQAITHFECPAQNIAYADGGGNIAMWAQGRFINKWKGQGKYVMRGIDSSTLWGEPIPMAENPHVLNPLQGYVASANQQVTDSTYPYWYNGSFVEWRSWEINDWLSLLQNRPCPSVIFPTSPTALSPVGTAIGSIPPFDPRYYCVDQNNRATYLIANELQNDVVSLLLMKTRPIFRDKIEHPNIYLSPESDKVTEFQLLWSQLYKDIWQDEFPTATKYPSSELTVQLLLNDSASKYYDDKTTQQVETLRDIVKRAFKETTDSLEKLKRSLGSLEWYKVKNTSLTHLAKIPAFSYTGLKIGGWSNTINAVTGNHGPSWRMIVEMDSIPKAYAIYPGGQSGNPGSRHYGDFVQQWVEGKYHAIQFYTANTTKNPLPYTWTLTP